MMNFKQYFEALGSHGGFWFQKNQPSKYSTAKNGHVKWEFPDYASYVNYVSGKNDADSVAASKTKKILDRVYKDVIGKLDEKLLKLEDYNIHIYFGLPTNIKKILTNELGKRSVSFEGKDIGFVLKDYFFRYMGIPSNDIVFVKTGPSGDPLTPWMILHSLGHALTSSDFGKEFSSLMTDALDSLKEHFNVYGIEERKCLFNFRSARMAGNYKKGGMFNPVDSREELIHELVAYYLWTGGTMPLPNQECINKLATEIKIDYKKISWFSMPISSRVRIITNILEKFYNQVRTLITNVLEQSRGVVLVDLFPELSDLK